MSPSPPTLVVLDDEERILSALRRTLRREGWRLLTTTDPAEALRWLVTEPVAAVLSDARMPGIGGVDFLELASQRCPGAARLLITGWPQEVPRQRLDALGIRALIPKPWDDAQLKAVLRAALANEPAG